MEPARTPREEGREGQSAFWPPIIGIKRKRDEEAEKDITKQNTRVLVGFRNAYVFDVEQTEGVELPAMREVYGDVGETTTDLFRSSSVRASSLSIPRRLLPRLA